MKINIFDYLQPASAAPQLNIAGDGSLEGLWQSLGEMLKEDIDHPLKELDATPNLNKLSSPEDDIEEICQLFLYYHFYL